MPFNKFSETKYDNVNKRTALIPEKIRYSVNSNKMKVFVLSNLFIGSDLTDIQTLKEYISKIKSTPGSTVIILGNLLEKQSTKDQIQKRLEVIANGDTLESINDFITEEQVEVIKLLNPIKDKIAVAVRGKQEYEVQVATGVDPLKVVFETLKIKDRYVGDSFILDLGNKNKESIQIYGTNGGAESTSIKHRKVKKTSTLLNSLMDVADSEYNYCDWYLVSTNGSFEQIEDSKEFFDNIDHKVVNKTRRFTCVDGWINYTGSAITSENKTFLNNHKIFEWYFRGGKPQLIRHDYQPSKVIEQNSSRSR